MLAPIATHFMVIIDTRYIYNAHVITAGRIRSVACYAGYYSIWYLCAVAVTAFKDNVTKNGYKSSFTHTALCLFWGSGPCAWLIRLLVTLQVSFLGFNFLELLTKVSSSFSFPASSLVLRFLLVGGVRFVGNLKNLYKFLKNVRYPHWGKGVATWKWTEHNIM